MDVQDFRKGISLYLQQELGMPAEHGEPQSISKERVFRAADEVFRKVVERAFPEAKLPKFTKIIQTMDPNVQQRIFDACVGVQKGDAPEKVLIEVALWCAQQNVWETALYFKKFALTDPKAIVEIAKLCARQDACGTALYFQNFALTDQQAAIKIAKLCAQQDGYGTALYFQNFALTDQQAAIKIAKLCAQQNGGGTAVYFKNFGITDPQAIIEIAEFCARQDGRGTAAFFKNFGITDQQAIIKIAKLCAQQNGQGTAENFQNLGIKDQRIIEVAAYCLAYVPEAFKDKRPDLMAVFGSSLPPPVLAKLNTAYYGAYDVIQDPSSDLLKALRAQEGFEKALAVPGNKELLLSIVCFCQATKKMDALKSSAIQEIISALLQFRDPRSKTFARDSLLDVISDSRIGNLEKFIEGKIPTRSQSKLLTYVFLMAVFGMQNIQSPLREKVVDDFLAHLRTFFPTASETAAFIEFVRALNGAVAGTEAQGRLYGEFVSVALDRSKKGNLSKNLFLFRAAIAFRIDVAGLTYEQIQEEVRKRLPFPEGWEKTFESLRRPESLFVYAGKIHLLNEFERGRVLEALQRWMVEVKEGTFLENRYSQSPQLTEMKKLLPEWEWDTLLSKWKEGRKEVIGSEPVAVGSGTLLNGKAFFEDKRRNGHFPADKTPLLCAVLDSAPGLREGPLNERIDFVIKEGKKYPPEERFDALCARLAQQSPMTLKYVQDALKIVPHGWELQNDLAGLVTQASAPVGELSGYTVENTDDYWDLFLCGTEVAGSCQRVGGDPNLNKNLLGYVVDGKCRMIAVKDKSGHIVARSIIKLLWDDERKRPVLLSEKVYSNNVKLDRVVEKMASEEAARLGVELVTLGTANGRKFQSWPNRSGFEYEDAKDVIQPEEPTL